MILLPFVSVVWRDKRSGLLERRTLDSKYVLLTIIPTVAVVNNGSVFRHLFVPNACSIQLRFIRASVVLHVSPDVGAAARGTTKSLFGGVEI
jgi:hypothetical protein